MWSSDYPHHGNDWPYSRKVIEETMNDIPAAEKAQDRRRQRRTRLAPDDWPTLGSRVALDRGARAASGQVRAASRSIAPSVRRCSVRWCT